MQIMSRTDVDKNADTADVLMPVHIIYVPVYREQI